VVIYVTHLYQVILVVIAKKNYEVSTDFYKAKRYINNSWVIGYLVKLKNNGEIQGILNKDSSFMELAYIDVNTVTKL